MNADNHISFRNITVFPMGKIISGLRMKERDNTPVMQLCEKYEAALKSGKHAFQLCEQFTTDLGAVANTDVVRSVVKRCNKILKENERDLANMRAAQSLYESTLSYIAKNIEYKLSAYLSDKTVDNRNTLHEAISVFAGNSAINSILENLSYDEYELKHGKKLNNLKTVSVKEEKTYTEEEVAALINEKMKEMEDNKKSEVSTNTSFKDINTHIELDKTIKKILENCGTNKKLAVFCMNYYNELNRGISEEMLYESFISGISNWNFMPAVDTEISALRSRTEKYKQEIDLKKVLEYMSQTGSYYIVPLIEECVMDYINEKTLANKAILKQRLAPFEFDPFVRDIENILFYDLSIPNTVYLGESVEKKNAYVHTDMIYSPVLYIKENESVFNVKGMYYVKKGNSISRLPKRDIPALPESFTSICNCLNADNVEIINETNEIKVYHGSDVAVISEGAITLNGKKVTTTELSKLCEHFHIMGDDKNVFYKEIQELNEAFNDIAYIDFVKHVALNEDVNHYVDVFRVKNNIFVTTVDKANGISTFYKNVNPIQCRKYINEHMGLNIGEIFEDILPSQDTVRKMILEKRALYENYFEELQSKEAELNALKDDPDTDDSVIDNALQIVRDEMEKAKSDYRDYVNNTDNYLNGDPVDAEKSTDAEADDFIDKPEGEIAPESPEEMSVPIEDEPDFTGSDFTGSSDDIVTIEPETEIDMRGISDYDGLLDTPAKTEEGDTCYKVVDVRYDYNIKADKTGNKGELIVIIPTVDMNGDIHNDMKRITFYIDESGKPIINNEYMPLDMYMTIVDAINSNPKTSEVIDHMKTGKIVHRTPNEENKETSQSAENVTYNEPVADTTVTIDSASFDEPADFNIEDEEFDKILADLDTDDSFDEADSKADSKADDSEDFQTPNSDTEPINPARQESPEEQRKDGETVTYPIDVPLNLNDINPISKSDFEGDLDEAGIKHTQSESDSQEICFTITDKSQVRWLKNYFKEWKGYGEAEFNSFFPELKNCMENKGSIPTMKLESIILPYNESYAKLFHVEPDKNEVPAAIRLVFESEQDKDFTYNTIKKYARTHALDENAQLFVEKYEKEKLNESSLIKVPYSSFLHQKLSAMDFTVKVLNENLYITVNGQNFKKAKNVFESFYKNEMPNSVKQFIADLDKLNENVKITIEADGKTVTINTDDLAKSSKKDDSEDDNNVDDFDPDKSFEAVTTFDDDTMNPYGNEPDDEDADDEKEDNEDGDKKSEHDEDSKPLKDEESETDNEEDDVDEKDGGEEDDKKEKKEKSRKKIVIKKKNESKNESAQPILREPDIIDQILTESAKPTVMDNVKLADGRKGQIVYQMANGDFIVNVSGRTVECAQNSVSMVNERPDTVECPYRFDPKTLKGLFEQYVKCGMFMNGIKMTPDDCKMKYFDYVNACNEDKVTVLVENQKLSIDRKYIRILEDVNTFANIAEYEKLGDRYFYNKKDFNLAESVNDMNASVRILADTGEKWELMTVSAHTLKP